MTTPRLPSAYTEAGPLPHTGTGKFENEGAEEVDGPAVLCHCGLACNKLEAKTEKNAGRCAHAHCLVAALVKITLLHVSWVRDALIEQACMTCMFPWLIGQRTQQC